MTIVGVQLIDRVGRRRLLLIGALGMCCSEFIVAIVGVTVGTPHETASGLAVNITAQRVLIAFTCMYVLFFLRFRSRPEELMVLQLHRVLRYIMGTSYLGAHGRDLRTCIYYAASCSFLNKSVCSTASRNPCQGHVALRREQLAMELRHRIRHPLPRRQVNDRRQRRQSGQSRREGVLHLGRNLCRVPHLHVRLSPHVSMQRNDTYVYDLSF